MSCCGNKRKEFQKENIRSSSKVHIPLAGNRKVQKSKVFEYIGASSKKIIIPTSGRIYYFRFKGHRIVVPHEDTFAMMAENDLKVIAK